MALTTTHPKVPLAINRLKDIGVKLTEDQKQLPKIYKFPVKAMLSWRLKLNERPGETGKGIKLFDVLGMIFNSRFAHLFKRCNCSV